MSSLSPGASTAASSWLARRYHNPKTATLQSILTTQSDILVAISTHSTPYILSRHPQKIRTNQTTFSNAYPPSDFLITQGEGVQILDYPSFHPLHSLAAHTSSCTAIAYSPSGPYLALGGSDAIISLWNTSTWICARTVSNPTTGKVANLTWSWDGRYLFGSSEEISGAIEKSGFDIYHAETGEVVHTIVTGKNAIAAAEWHPSRYWLAYTLVEEKTGRSSLHIIGAAGGPSI
jgi:THO complex subunit 3